MNKTDLEPFRRYYSQHGEDYLLWKFFDFKPIGFFIDIGAFDGKYISNSYSFEENGWSGICIEPIPKYFALCQANRPKSICVNNAVIGNNDIDVIDFFQDELGLYSSCELNEETLEYIKKCYEKDNIQFNGIKQYKVHAKTLNQILEAHMPSGIPNIDFVSIDVEGIELEVLKGFDLNKYQPKILIIEANDEIKTNTIKKYILENGNYIFSRKVGVNLFFVKNIDEAKKLSSIKINCIIEKQLHPMGENFSLSNIMKGSIYIENMPFEATLDELKKSNYRKEQLINNKNKLLEQRRIELDELKKSNYRKEQLINNKNKLLEQKNAKINNLISIKNQSKLFSLNFFFQKCLSSFKVLKRIFNAYKRPPYA